MMKPAVFVALASMALFASASPAFAEKPYYFHKAGVDRNQYMDDVNDCAELAGGVRAPRYDVIVTGPNPTYNAIAAGVTSFFAALANGRERRRLISRVERTCMADKGYQRRSIDKASYKEIDELEGKSKIDRMFALVSVDQPSGEVLIE